MNPEDIHWAPIVIQLTAFADYLIRKKSWPKDERELPNEKTAQDFAVETILEHLENPNEFAPSTGSLLNFLKHKIISKLG